MITSIKPSVITRKTSTVAGKIRKSLNTAKSSPAQELPPHEPKGFFKAIKSLFNKTMELITSNAEHKIETVTIQPKKSGNFNNKEALDQLPPVFFIKPEKTKVQELQETLISAAKAHKEPPRKPFRNPFALPPLKEQKNTPQSSFDLQSALLQAAKKFDFTEKPSKPSAMDLKIKEIGAHLQKMQEQKSLSNAVVDFVSKKLGNKTFESQKADFAQNATKMRMNLLPEIFASIAETRKFDRAAGISKSRSANKDALSLFQKINTNNKRLVNYLLKIRKNDGSRVYEVKDIISIMQDAENAIKQKKNSTEKFMAHDVKEFYREILKTNIEKFGKVTRRKNAIKIGN